MCGVGVCADCVCDCGCVHLVQRAAASAVPRGQRWDRQPLLDEPGNVLHCLCNEGAVSVPFLLLFQSGPLLLSISLLLSVSRLCHLQLPAGCWFRGQAFSFGKCFSHRCVER